MKRPYYYVDNYTEKCWCRRHETYHDCGEHGYDSRTPHGYRYFCEESALWDRTGIGPNKEKVEELTRKYADELLVGMGYDPTSTIPVHEQFLIKHDL